MQLLGEFLKTERERKGIRLSDISSVTKIQLHNLKLIEEGNWKALPAKPFVKGFLTAYAKYVGLNSNEVYQKYLEETQPSVSNSEISEVAAPSISESPLAEVITTPKVLQMKPILISVATFVFLVGSIWLIRLGKESSEVAMEAPSNQPPTEASREIASAPETTPVVTPAPVVAATPEVKPSPPPAPAPAAGHEIEVSPKEHTWVKVVIDDAPPVSMHLNSQEKTKFSAKEKIKLVLGNSTGSEVLYNGTVTEGKKYSGTIRYYIFPAGSKFPQDKPRQVAQESTTPLDSNPETDLESDSESNQE